MTRKQWLWVLGVAMVVYFLAFAIPEQAMHDAGGPGITEFELAATADRAAEYMADWGESGVSAAKWALWMDFPFILLFASFFALLTRAAADRCRDREREALERAGRKLWIAPIAAGCFDVLEDIGLLAILYGNTGSLAPAAAAVFATAKFTLLAITFAYLITVAIATRRKPQPVP